MHFMLLIFVVLLCIVVWGFFHSNPEGVSRRALGACNALVLALALLAAAVVGTLLYGDAVTVKSGEKGMATYLALMAAGTTFLIVVSVGGMVRNLAVFPRSRRSIGPPATEA